jgi:rhodanese-related sulfurtransferase
MDWIYALIAVALVAVFLLLKRAGQISSKAAVACLRDGAMVIDVRSAAEYTSAHLPNAVNMPVSEIKALAQRKIPDKSRVLLLHCQSGMRSGTAKGILRNLGYANAFNLGSYARAARIVKTH